jgi:hypothetical protein
MTDEEAFKALMGRFGIPMPDPANWGQQDERVYEFEANSHGLLRGYVGFVNVFGFSEDGSFRFMGAWE